MVRERSIGKGIHPGCVWDKPCRRHVRKVQIAACGGFAAFAGVWGVPSQRFRISQKDILKHCWQEEAEHFYKDCYREYIFIEDTDKMIL